MSDVTCRHCGRKIRDWEGGWAAINGNPVCHPNSSDRPDCYRLVTVYGEELGSRQISNEVIFTSMTVQKLDREHGDSWSLLLGVLRKTGSVTLNVREFGDATHGETRKRSEIYLELDFATQTVTLRVVEEKKP